MNNKNNEKKFSVNAGFVEDYRNYISGVDYFRTESPQILLKKQFLQNIFYIYKQKHV